MSLITNLEFIDDPKGDIYLEGIDIQLHDYLTEKADWDAEFWDFEIDYLQNFSEILEKLYQASRNGFVFQALWVGDEPVNVVEISIDEFIDIVRRNRIGTKSQYLIKKNS